ncbi:MAG: hypothetical protein KDD82_21100 [Planctomycetes bacterium]|nr:hypothetical protein [Planctomycetota bacterium]
MADTIKFSSKIEQQALDELRRFAKESGRSISSILTEAVTEYLARARVRPVFLNATEQVLNEHSDLLTRLAQ